MSKYYFGILYNIFKEAIEFKNENMNDVDIFNSDKFLKFKKGTSFLFSNF